MGILSARALLGRIPTAGEALSDSILLDLIRDPDTSQVRLLVWSGKEANVAALIQFRNRRYIPPNVEPSVLAALRLPTAKPPEALATRALFDEITRQLAQFTELPERSLNQIAYFIFATWLVDRVHLAPFLWVVSPSAADGSEFLHLLSLFCRRSLLLSADSVEGLWTLPMNLRPTLLLDGVELTSTVQKFLRASHSRGTHCAKRGQALDLYCAKAVASQDSLRDPGLANIALQISLPPTRGQFPALTQEKSLAIANEFQSKLLGYRLTYYQQVRTPEIDVQGLTSAAQGLARSLAACILGDKRLQAEIVPLLRSQAQQATEERSTGIETMILAALLNYCHEPDRSTVRAAELAEATNALLVQEMPGLRISPETVGWKLRLLRFRTETIGSGGKGFWLFDDVRRRIHSLAREYRVTSELRGTLEACPYCLISKEDSGTTRGEKDEKSDNPPKV